MPAAGKRRGGFFLPVRRLLRLFAARDASATSNSSSGIVSMKPRTVCERRPRSDQPSCRKP